MKPLHPVLLTAGLLLLGGLTWLAVSRPKPPAPWLRVEAPRRIAPGGTATIRVTALTIQPGLWLSLDLHGQDSRHHPLHLVSHGRMQRVDAPGQAIDFQLTVPARPDLATVHAIIYVSPDGMWAHRIHVAKSEPIPVEAGVPGLEPHPLHAHELTPDPAIPRTELPGLRWLVGLLWLVVAAGLMSRRLRLSADGPSARPVALLGACVLVALVEGVTLEPALGGAARNLARRLDLYDSRLLPQQIAIAFTVTVVAALALGILFKARHRRVVLGLLAHAAIAFTAVLSLHETDVLLYATVAGIPVEQLVKLAAVALALWGLRPFFKVSPVAGPA